MTAIDPTAPEEFRNAAERILASYLRPELAVEQIPAPTSLAPHALALAATLDQTSEFRAYPTPSTGRFILLFDPMSADEWGAPFRIVAYGQAPLELEIGLDQFIADVSWSWLLDALETRHAAFTQISGTATKTLSTGYGGLAEHGSGAGLELRASWTPLGNDFGAHAEAWSQLLCLLAGLPHETGTASLDQRRAHRLAAQRTS